MRLLDEAMVAVVAGETSPIVVGDNCTAIDACHDVFDVRRGQAWTAAFGRWCDTQPDLVPYAGLCLVHRAEFLQLKGAWVEATARPGSPGAAVLAGRPAVTRSRDLPAGRAAAASRAFRRRGAALPGGQQPRKGSATRARAAPAGPGQARCGGAWDRPGSRRGGRPGEPPSAAGGVRGDHAGCRRRTGGSAACAELVEAARALGSPMLAAVSDRATGAVVLADGDARAALAPLRRASLRVPRARGDLRPGPDRCPDRPRARVLGDEEGARFELEAARAALEGLGAMADVGALDVPDRGRAAATDRVLTGRELQVLRLVARGLTNRSVGVELGLSERTVDRHVSNIFAKRASPRVRRRPRSPTSPTSSEWAIPPTWTPARSWVASPRAEGSAS